MSDYDYDYAILLGRRLLKALPGHIPDIVLALYPKPIMPLSAIDSEDVGLVSLQGPSTDTELIFRLYRQNLTLSGTEDFSAPWIEAAIRQFLYQLGSIISGSPDRTSSSNSPCA